MTNPLLSLGDAGQSVWLDYLHQNILQDGTLKHLIEADGLKGLTSNPSIFEKAIGGGDDYGARLKSALDAGDAGVMTLYEHLAIGDIQRAADGFRPVYERLNRLDGYVSLEVSPYLAMDTDATITEARRLWRAVDRPNLMIKVPGTKAGVPAIRQLIGEGINVNVTLLFSIDAYVAVSDAYVGGLEALKSQGGDVSRTHSVASFFLSRIDVAIDKKMAQHRNDGADDERNDLRGKAAIASARIAYQHYLTLIDTPRWKALADVGAAPQRLLWASTSTKDPSYSDVLYVSELIGRDTINTMPPKTMDAFRDHGEVRPSLTENIQQARDVIANIERLGLDLHQVTDDLVDEGVRLFAQSFDELLGAVASKRAAILGDKLNGQTITAPPKLAATQDKVLKRAMAEGWTRRLWARDASLWTDAGESAWLGWLGAGRGEGIDLPALATLQRYVQAGDFTYALLMGMGGSSLGPEVLSHTFPPADGFPELLILDSTDPAEIARIDAEIDLRRTLFIVSSKSGSTLEPNVLHDYFYARAVKAVGEAEAAARWIAITDPGSPLDALALREGFGSIFHGDLEIGGRYSVLSNFGLVPAAIIGLDVAAFLDKIRFMVRACGADAPATANPGFQLGAFLGTTALAGRDKVTIHAAEPIADFGAWLEQLLAESTGKHGGGLIPISDEPLGVPEAYGDDRIFVSLGLEGQSDSGRDAALDALELAGHPVVRICVTEKGALGQEFFRWEMAVAVAGVVLGLNPFDQPDVEAAKVKAVALTDAYEKSGALTTEVAILESEGLALYADTRNSDVLARMAKGDTLGDYVSAHLRRAQKGDYIGLLFYLDRNRAHRDVMRKMRTHLRDKLKVATVGCFGPRYLHSTGQAYKGGPNSGVFLQVTAEVAQDIKIPGRNASFGIVASAQAQGDFDILAERGRRILRLHLGTDIEGGLQRLANVIGRSFS